MTIGRTHTVWRHLSNAVDHLSCLQALFGDAKVIHMYAPFTLVRGALENACGAVWLLQPARRKERLARRFRLAIGDIRHEVQAGELMGQAGPQSGQGRVNEMGVALLEGVLTCSLPDFRVIGAALFYRRVQGKGGSGWAR